MARRDVCPGWATVHRAQVGRPRLQPGTCMCVALQSTAPHTGVDRPEGEDVHVTALHEGRWGKAEPEPHRLYTSASPVVQRQGVKRSAEWSGMPLCGLPS